MNALKDFFRQNKMLVSMTGSATLGLFLVFTIIAVIISGTPTSANPTAPETSASEATQNIANNESSDSTDDTVPPYINDETTCGSEDESTEEPTTEPPVDPNTLPYMIMVNRAANCVTVYGKDDNGKFTIPVKAITVSCGKQLDDTPTGTYQTINEYKWRKMVDGTYAQYAYRIVGPILFHSVPYYTQSKNDLEWEEFNKLGTSASLGCVRMTVVDAKWLMDNCPIGTLVKIYDDVANPGPLGKPETIKIPADTPDELKVWDPTDPDPANPWKLHSASITYPASKVITVTKGATIEEILANFSAKDTCGNDISYKIQLTGNVDTSALGAYTNITVGVTDAIGSHAEVVVTIIVQSESKPNEDSGDKPGEDSGDKPGEDSGDKPGEDSGDKPGEDSGDKPGEDSGDKPGEDSGDKPGEDSGDKPGEDSGDKPGEDSGDESGKNPDNEPMEGSDSNPSNEISAEPNAA